MAMRLPASIAMAAVLAAAGACTPASNDAIDVGPPAPSERASTDRIPAAAAGKISADQVGKVSPVPAFQGGAADWSVEILAVGDMRHGVTLTTGAGVQTGTAVYRPSANAPSQILLTGTLYASGGDRALRITLARGECRDAAGVHRHDVRVDIEGATSLQGCGDLAMY
jgi:hypothetical protein